MNADTGTVPAPLPSIFRQGEASDLATKFGLRQAGKRPSLPTYIKELWSRRSFMRVMATSKAYAENRESYLGQLWSILNPMLNAGVYIVIFGFILGTKRGLGNVMAFIVVGTFMWRLFNSCVMDGARAIDGNLSLVRSLKFPRAVLPLSAAMAQITSFLPSVGVMIVLCYLVGFVPGYSHVQIKWSWLLLPVALALFALFNLGCSMLMARFCTGLPDVVKTIPFLLRFAMYFSGVVFSIPHFVDNHVMSAIMQYQPAAAFLTLARMCLLSEKSIPWNPTLWWVCAAWAIGIFLIGFLLFWQKEESYGRD